MGWSLVVLRNWKYLLSSACDYTWPCKTCRCFLGRPFVLSWDNKLAGAQVTLYCLMLPRYNYNVSDYGNIIRMFRGPSLLVSGSL
jgi:hypothetical protein